MLHRITLLCQFHFFSRHPARSRSAYVGPPLLRTHFQTVISTADNPKTVGAGL